MGVRDTSRVAYKELQFTGKEGGQEDTILKCVQNSVFPMSRREISNQTGIELSAVCGRVNKLINQGFLEEDRLNKRECSISHKMIHPVMPANCKFDGVQRVMNCENINSPF